MPAEGLRANGELDDGISSSTEFALHRGRSLIALLINQPAHSFFMRFSHGCHHAIIDGHW
jgi:hypothetical protein